MHPIKLTRSLQLGLLALFLALQGCGTGGVERWHVSEARTPQAAASVPGATVQPVAVVFFREAGAGASASQPINVYVNGQFQGALVGNNFNEQALCPGQHSVVAALNDVQQRYASKELRSNFVIGSAPMQYFRISEGAGGQIMLAPATVSAAEAAVPSLRSRQAHTVSRVTRTGCPAS